MRKTIVFFFFILIISAQAQVSRLSQLNFSGFSQREKSGVEEIKSLIGPRFSNHPEIGLYPHASQMRNKFIELIDKRDAYSRYFVERGSKGTHYLTERGYTPLNYLDQNGWWREIDHRLQRTQNALVYSAPHQRQPVSIDLNKRQVILKNDLNEIAAANNIRLVHLDGQGRETDLGPGNWSNYTIGEDGLYVKDFYSNIDLVITVGESQTEINFVLNINPGFSDGQLVMKQSFGLSNKLQPQIALAQIAQEHFILNAENKICYTIDRCIAYSNDEKISTIALSSTLDASSELSVYTPVSWLNQTSTVYPVVIDPVITSADSLLVAAIIGTKYSPVCWTNSCDYNLVVPTPPNATVTRIFNSFGYQTIATCQGMDGGFSLDYGACHWPATAPGVFTCNFPVSLFTCVNDSENITDFIPCFPAPSCAPQNLNFTLHFYRCNHDPDVNCTSNCVRAAENWKIVIEGRTLEMNYFTPSATICGGANVNLIADAQFGVPPYTYSWTPAATNNDTIVVAPAVTTTYSVTVTDQCGNTVTGIDTLTVQPNLNPGFTINPITVCVNQNINLSGNGVGAVTNYDWVVPGSNAPGGVINDNQNPVIQYSVAGNYNITLRYFDALCSYFDSTLSITVTTQSTPNVVLNSVNAGPYCIGDTIHFSATPTNGGVAPQYDWIVDGSLIQSGSVDTFATASLHNGSIVQVVLHSNSACVSTTIDTASTFIPINSAVIPTVTANPDTSVCPNSPLTFQLTALNEGTAPQYQWYVNGIASPGATGTSFSTVIGPNDSLVSVLLTSSLRCVTSPVTRDTAHVTLLQNVSPQIDVTSDANALLCQGDTVHFTTASQFGGATPTYQWYVNGVASGAPTTDSTFNFIAHNGRDSISVRMVSSLACLASGIANDFQVINGLIAVQPTVNISTNPPIVCEGQALSFIAQPHYGGTNPTFEWQLNGQAGGSGATFSPGILQNNDTVTVLMTSNVPCAIDSNASGNFVINNLISPVADFTYTNPYPGAFLNQISFTNTSILANSFVWYFIADSDTVFVRDPIHQFPGQGNFDVTLFAINSNGCIDSVNYTVIVSEPVAVFFPRAFTPNGDNINEFFEPIGASLTDYVFYIYNRWGQIIFTGNEKKAWNGIIDGTSTPAPEGVYVYKLEANGLEMDEKRMVGRVTLIR